MNPWARCVLKSVMIADLVEEGWRILWVVDFPMFEKGEGRLSACHHPFTAPKADTVEELMKDPQNMFARAYDMVLNGSEIGGGSMRINSSEMQKAVFNILNISEEEAEEKFGHLLTAMRFRLSSTRWYCIWSRSY